MSEREEWAKREGKYKRRKLDNIVGFFTDISRKFEVKLTITKIIFGSLRWIFPIIILLIPTILKQISTGPLIILGHQLTFLDELVIGGGIFTLMCYSKTYDYVIKVNKDKKEYSKYEEILALRLTNATKYIISGTTFPPGKVLEIQNEAARCIREHVRLILKNFDDKYLEVSIITFSNSAAGTLEATVASRAHGVRGIGSRRLAADIMAYYVARSGRARNVHDFRSTHPFPKTGISDFEPRYRSILFLPVIDADQNGNAICRGVVTIDSERPFEFWGGSERRIVVRVQPYLNIIGGTLGSACPVPVDLGG